jgi:hypothetical protein
LNEEVTINLKPRHVLVILSRTVTGPIQGCDRRAGYFVRGDIGVWAFSRNMEVEKETGKYARNRGVCRRRMVTL